MKVYRFHETLDSTQPESQSQSFQYKSKDDRRRAEDLLDSSSKATLERS